MSSHEISEEGSGQGALIGLAAIFLLASLIFLPPHLLRQIFMPATQPSMTVVGPPSISVRHIDHILDIAKSPARGTGQALHDLGVQHNIDPAIALAFFQRESGYGTQGIATRTLSLGNIRCSDGYQCIDGFRAYGSWGASYLDWYRLISDLYIKQWGLDDVVSIVERYAPIEDGNDPAAYARAVEEAVRTWRGGSDR